GELHFRSRSLWDGELSLPPTGDDSETIQTIPGPNNQTLLTLITHFHKHDRTMTILVAEEIGLHDRLVNMAQFWYALIAISAMTLVLVLQRVMIERRLRPLKQASDALLVQERENFQTLPTETVPQELLPFIVEINRLLTILSHR
ncbi:MAG: hypothetical protein HQM00_17535, partial [Magnetococcales bacterium]|nr:hypothetical protein [Magnetococcales bacterium]